MEWEVGGRFYVFTSRVRQPTTSGGDIFLCLKKDIEERQTKGLQSRPLDSGFYTGVRRGDVRASYEFARVQLTRFRPVRGVLRTVSTDSCVLHELRRIRNIYRITGLICGRKAGGSMSVPIILGRAARRGKGISEAPQPT